VPFGIKAAVMLEILSHTVPPRAPELSQAAITAPSVLAVSERPLDGEFSVPKKHIHIVVRLLPPPPLGGRPRLADREQASRCTVQAGGASRAGCGWAGFGPTQCGWVGPR
jgi:hypothetical protein